MNTTRLKFYLAIAALFATLAMLSSCKKEETATPQITQINQKDIKLIGYWMQDSSCDDLGNIAEVNSLKSLVTQENYIDTIYVGISKIVSKYTWDTNQDTLYKLSTSGKEEKYKYIVNNNFLELYSIKTKFKYWYHK